MRILMFLATTTMRRLSILCIALALACSGEWRSAEAFSSQQLPPLPTATTATSCSSSSSAQRQRQQQQQQQQRAREQRQRHRPRRAFALPATRASEGAAAAAASTTGSNGDSDLSSFAASLDEGPASGTAKKEKASSTASGTTAQQKKAWQNDLDELLDPKTEPGRRQVLLRELLSANQDIRASVEKALKDRNIDPLLTPTGRKLQAGTRAVARQISSDILPSLAETARTRSSGGGGGGGASAVAPPAIFPPIVPPADLPKVGGRVLSALQNQFQKNLETLRGDISNPTRIPERLSKQTEELFKEAVNVFSETPVGLKEPKYTLVRESEDYEIRDYEAYKVASTNIMSAGSNPGEVYRFDNVAQTGAAFNSLAAYLFGANRESKVMEMTTPVATTVGGEMRFYLSDDEVVPEPFEEDESKSAYETGGILIEEIPPARLAVRRFTGFVTEGEIARQKEALLAALELDGVELDVPHGQTVGYVVFQYNPPYTIPVIRRNEIAIPVVGESSEVEERLGRQSLKEPWAASTSDGDDDEDAEEPAE